MSIIIDKIKSRGYWEVIIRPTQVKREKISDYSKLLQILYNSVVKIRGWDFPHIDPNKEIQRGEDWIGQEIEWNQYLEHWRFFQSGQFYHISGLDYDWYDQSELLTNQKYPTHSSVFGVSDTIYRATEIYEIASRLSQSTAESDSMYIKIIVANLKNRRIWMDDPRRMPFLPIRDRSTSMDSFPHISSHSSIELLSNSRKIALDLSKKLFQRFGWNPKIQQLREIQGEFPH